MEPYAELTERCIVCQSTIQDGKFKKLYTEEDYEQYNSLSAEGILYEELIGQLETEKRRIFPQYICLNCKTQLELFKALKTKAHESLEECQKVYEAAMNKSALAFAAAVEEAVSDSQMYIDESENIPVNFAKREDEREFIDDSQVDATYYEEDVNSAEDYAVEFIESELEEIDDGQQEQMIFGYQFDIEQNQSHVDHTEAAESMELHTVQRLDDKASTRSSSEHFIKIETKPLEFKHLEEDSSDYLDEEEYLNLCVYGGADYLESDIEKVEQLSAKSDVKSCETQSSKKKVNKIQGTQSKKSRDESLLKLTYKCFACDVMFLDRSTFASHRNEAHFGKYPCNLCPKLFKSNDALQVHFKVHTQPSSFVCHICQKAFNQKAHLKYHLAHHHEDKRDHKCDQCEKGFISKSDLKIHQRIHIGKRSYCCETCGKDFLLLQHLKTHQYSHYEKSFECTLCHTKFISPTTLRTHMRSIHSQPRFVCEICSKIFNRKHHLEAHYRTHAKEGIEPKQREDENIDPYVLNETTADILLQFAGANHFDFKIDEELVDDIIVEDSNGS